MNYVANSDVLKFVQAIGGDLDLLFQVLWKHVLCVEFVRLRWSVEDEGKSRNVFTRLWDRFSKTAKKQKALNYLKAWQGRFWITTDENIREITEGYESKLASVLGGEIAKFNVKGQYDRQLSIEKKSELAARARQIIDSGQLAALGSVIEMLAETAADDQMTSYYILIDKLDERWVDTTIKYKLIRSLIETLKSFQKLGNLKIVVALRADILERAIQETNDSYQREKWDDYFVQIVWTKDKLNELAQRRISHLFQRKYTRDNIKFEDLFTSDIGTKKPFEYILSRTLMRPRDVIAFINECLRTAENHSAITATNIRKAEAEYSRKRKEALEDEWRSAFPTLGRILTYISRFKNISIDISEMLDSTETQDLALAISSDKQIDRDPIYTISTAYCNDAAANHLNFIREIIALLYRIGVIGVGLTPADKLVYSHINGKIILQSTIAANGRIQIHPILYGAFQLNGG